MNLPTFFDVALFTIIGVVIAAVWTFFSLRKKHKNDAK